MNDTWLNDLIVQADPFDPAVIDDLRGADLELMEEVMIQPKISGAQRTLRSRVAGSLAVAAVLTTAIGVPIALNADNGDRTVVRSGSGEQIDTKTTPIKFSSAALKEAANNSRLLIQDPSWEIDDVEGFGDKDPSGSVITTDGETTIDYTAYLAADHDAYVADRDDGGIKNLGPVTVAGQQGLAFQYAAADYEVLLSPDGATFTGMRISGGPDLDLASLLAKVQKVDVQTWLSAMPAEVVTPERADAAVDALLQDVQVPPGFESRGVLDGGTNDAYQTAAKVSGAVMCGWFDELQRAQQANDSTAAQVAIDAVSSSRDWKMLTDIADRGGWSGAVWEAADAVAGGADQEDYRDLVGCDGPQIDENGTQHD